MVGTDPSVIELRCKKCNQKFFDYEIHNPKGGYIMDGVQIKCARCNRVLRLMKYTEEMVQRGAVKRNDRLVKSL